MPTLDSLLERSDIWRSRDRQPSVHDALPTGHADLDRMLGGGWPKGALIELLASRPGVGEWRLLAPRLADICRRGQWQLWVDPPLLPFAPALLQGGLTLERVLIVRTGTAAQWLWVCDQALRSPGCGAVLCWAPQRLRYAELRRLQVAARERDSMAFLLGPESSAETASPAVLRLSLGSAGDGGVVIQVLKQRGRAAGQRLVLAVPRGLQPQVPLRERPAVTSAGIHDMLGVEIDRLPSGELQGGSASYLEPVVRRIR